MTKKLLAVETLPVSSLQLRPDNPRLHSKKQIRQIASSIKSFGFNIPVLIDAELRVIAGHGRILASQLLGLKDVPAIRLDHLSERQLQAFAIADNRLTETSDWDDRLLGEQLKMLSEAELDFELEVTGFEVGEIDLIIEHLAPARSEENDPADELPEESLLPISQSGDLWRLGKHRLLCGDSRSANTYKLLMDGRPADMIFTDPPYNVVIGGHVSGNGKVRHREFMMGSGEMSESDFTDFLTETLTLLASNSLRGSLHFVFMDWRHMGELLRAGRDVYTELSNLCIWAKDNSGMGSFYRSQHELIFVFKNGDVPHLNNIQLGKFGRSRSNIWSYPAANSFANKTDEGNLLRLHPTVKPVAMVADAIMDCTRRGEIVLDAFLGSGTTIIAAERTGRTCYGVELDPLYIDTAIRRWERFTKLAAIHSATGQTFVERQRMAGNDVE